MITCTIILKYTGNWHLCLYVFMSHFLDQTTHSSGAGLWHKFPYPYAEFSKRHCMQKALLQALNLLICIFNENITSFMK
jgi:hypothetical protein